MCYRRALQLIRIDKCYNVGDYVDGDNDYNLCNFSPSAKTGNLNVDVNVVLQVVRSFRHGIL